ncbi:MAG: polynucleotide adenylyltransferase PcnB [Sedimenticola selenatireducens]|uniref:Poly(A) polymerase I n=1 Tax=Sedimenticola selenatireducens TaxID=191960 RepID=A0A2N6D0Q6_9GAMM|nr:polynucleotide adenylyltransferase PcnB [Sedimenticola selenatireducens]PLX63247.1 MAG: polynucleotide adenylyltransferase PcnB [Sedimenticola selenatireducens]
MIPRPEHNISRANISEHATKVLYRLKAAGFQSYLVGGGVRDLLLGREPKDFDVATDATPEEVKAVFRNCSLIGRRFRLAHVHFGREIIEVATFRSMQDASEPGDRETENGMLVRDNIYGSIEEDALRRDFTINALYYNIEDFSVVDYAGGMADLQSGVLRLLGDPDIRYREDPVRMLRAVRFAAKLGFVINTACEQPLFEMGSLLQSVPAARLFEEVLKLFMAGVALQSFEKLRHYGLFGELFPETEECLAHEDHEFPITFVIRGMQNTDSRIREGKPVTPAFLFAVLLWEPVRLLAERLRENGEAPLPAMQQAGSDILMTQLERVSIPKRFSIPMREIWNLQHRFEQRAGKRPHRLLTHPRFRAAYDFLLLRAEAGEVDQELADWWTHYQEQDGDERNQMVRQANSSGDRPRRRRRRRKRPAKPADPS